MTVHFATTSRPRALLLLLLFAVTTAAQGSSASQSEDEIKLCVAGKTMDIPCMREHRPAFEKYVLEETGDYTAKSFISRQLLAYYAITRVGQTAQSLTVRRKNTAYENASAVGVTFLQAHYHPCVVGLGCQKGVYLDQEATRERNLVLKQYFQNLNPILYRGEIKYLEEKIRLNSGM